MQSQPHRTAGNGAVLLLGEPFGHVLMGQIGLLIKPAHKQVAVGVFDNALAASAMGLRGNRSRFFEAIEEAFNGVFSNMEPFG